MQGELLTAGQCSVSLPNLQHKRTHYWCSGKKKDKLASDLAIGKLVCTFGSNHSYSL